MTIYVPLIYYELDGEEADIADVVFHGYYNIEDAKMTHPNVTILEVSAGGIDPQAN